MTQALIPGDNISMLNSQSIAGNNDAFSVPHPTNHYSSPKRQASFFAASPEPQTQLFQTSTMHLSKSSSNNNTFVHKLYNMVIDDQFQHLIAWNYTGASFIVCNIMEFARDVLPKHFKHNNFSSFVRQLNMYGFHKVNKSPRGHRTLAENQIWEFSHPKFLRGRTDLLDEIKRKTMESDTVRRETDLHAHLTMIQMSQSDMLQQINHLYSSFSQILREFYESKRRQEYQSQFVKNVVDYLIQKNGGELPPELDAQYKRLNKMNNSVPPPPIFVTDNTNPALFMPPPNSSNGRNSSFIPSTPNSINFNILTNSPPPITVSSALSTVSSASTSSTNYAMYNTTPIPSPTTTPLRPSTAASLSATSSSNNLLTTPAIPSQQHQQQQHYSNISSSSFSDIIHPHYQK